MKTQGKLWMIYDAEKKRQTKPMSVVQTQVVLLSLMKKKNPERFFLWTPGWAKWIPIKQFLASEQPYFVFEPPTPKMGDDADPEMTEIALDPDKTATMIESTPPSPRDNRYTQVVEGEAIKQKDYGYYFEDINASDLDLSKIRKVKPLPQIKKDNDKTVATATETEPSGADRRKDYRHSYRIEVVLVSKTTSFRTYSKNISLSGTLLEDEIPKEFLKKPFDLIILNPFESDPAKSRLLFRAKIVGDITDPRRLMFIEQDVEMTVKLDALLKAYVTYQSQMKRTAG
jgi:hypothetical protein